MPCADTNHRGYVPGGETVREIITKQGEEGKMKDLIESKEMNMSEETEHHLLITPEMAERWLINFTYEHQRPINNSHVELLASDMEAGEFLNNTTIAIAVYKGNQYIMNGRHRLSALIKSLKTIPFRVVLYPVNSITEMAELYLKFDIHRKRTQYDSLRAFDIANTFQLPKEYVNRTAGAVKIIMRNFPTGGSYIIRTKDLLENMINYEEGIRMYYKAISGREERLKKPLMRSWIASVGILTCQYVPDKALIFWSRVATDDELVKNSPEKQLAEFLKYTRMAGKSVFAFIKGIDMAKMAAYCFNCFYDNKNAFSKVPSNWEFVIKGIGKMGKITQLTRT